MAYSPFDPAKPDASVQSLTQMGQSARDNLAAMRDMIACNGMAPGFNASIGAGAPPEVTQWLYKQGARWIKVNLTWTGGVVTKLVYYISINSGGTYDPLADALGNFVLNLTYDAAGYFVSSTWGATP